MKLDESGGYESFKVYAERLLKRRAIHPDNLESYLGELQMIGDWGLDLYLVLKKDNDPRVKECRDLTDKLLDRLDKLNRRVPNVV